MNRIEKIKKYNETQNKIKTEKEALEKDKNEALQAKIRGLKPRITELIETANTCVENGIEIDVYGKSFDGSLDSYKKGTFVTNSITHRLGFASAPKGCKILWLGINAGGACGHLDFRTNGDKIFSMHEETKAIEAPSNKHLEEFLKNFDEFEKAFYDYVDSIIGKE